MRRVVFLAALFSVFRTASDTEAQIYAAGARFMRFYRNRLYSKGTAISVMTGGSNR